MSSECTAIIGIACFTGKMTMTSDHERIDLDSYISQLRRLANTLRATGLLILALTLMHFAFASLASPPKYSSGDTNVFASCLVFATVVIFAVLFEQQRRRGEIIYGEVTDDLHRHQADPTLDRPQISFRIALKHFAASTDLPLVPGRFGVSSYIFVNLMMVAVIFWRMYPSLIGKVP